MWIRYNSGSNPRTVWAVRPLKWISPLFSFVGICQVTNTEKKYYLSKITETRDYPFETQTWKHSLLIRLSFFTISQSVFNFNYSSLTNS
jgi:hypothetical protein